MVTQRDHLARPVEARFAAALAGLLFVSILLLWAPGRWAVSLYQAGVFAIAILWVARAPRWQWSGVSALLGAAVAWGLIQLLFNRTVYRWETWDAVLTWSTQLVCFLLGSQILAERRIRNGFLQAVFYFGFALSVVSVLQLFTAEGNVFWLFPSGYKDLVLGPFVYHNQFAAFVELVFPLAVVAALRDRNRALIYAGMAAALYASVIASASRAGAALVTLELIVILAVALARGHMSRRARDAGRKPGGRPEGLAPPGLALVSFAVLVVCFGAVVGWQTLWRRLQLPDIFNTRRELLSSSLDMVRARPGMGFGLGTWSTAYPAFAYSDDGLFANQAHNDWAQWAAEGGLPFFFLMLAIAIWSLKPALDSLWGVGILAVFLHSLVDYPVQRPALGGLFFVLLGALAASRADRTMRSASSADEATAVM